MATLPALKLRPKTSPPEGTFVPVPGGATALSAPLMPSQGHSQDDDDDNIPPPPMMPEGEFRCRVKSIYHPIDKETGKAQTWDDGTRKQSTVYFVISDPAEQRKQQAGKPNCFGVEVKVSLDFGMFYQRTLQYCTTLGCPQIGWPTNAKGKTTVQMLGEHILAVTKGKEFLVTAKTTSGKGENKAKLYTNVTKVATVAPAKAPPKPAPKPVAEEVADHLTDLGVLADEAAEESATGTNPDAPPADTTEEE